MENWTAGFWRTMVKTYVQRFPIAKGKRLVMEKCVPLYATPNEQVCRLPGGATMRVDLREHVQRFIYFFGVYETQTVHWFRSAIKPGMTVLDIGSHVGQYALIAASDVGKNGRVHCFEPNPANYARLTANLEGNGFQHVRAHQIALSDRGGSTTLYVPKNDNTGEGSLQACEDNSAPIEIRALTLDEWAQTADLGTPPRIDLLKIDVQGYETKVIEGARQIIETYHPTIVCEFEERWLRLAGSSSVELKELFHDLGYAVKRIDERDLSPVPMNEVHYFENLVLVPQS